MLSKSVALSLTIHLVTSVGTGVPDGSNDLIFYEISN